MPRSPKTVEPKFDPPFNSPTYRKAFQHGVEEALRHALQAVNLESDLEDTPSFEVTMNIILHPHLALRGTVKAVKATITNRIMLGAKGLKPTRKSL